MNLHRSDQAVSIDSMQVGSSACIEQTIQVIISKPSPGNLELAPYYRGSAEERLGEELTNSELHSAGAQRGTASSLVEIICNDSTLTSNTPSLSPSSNPSPTLACVPRSAPCCASASVIVPPRLHYTGSGGHTQGSGRICGLLYSRVSERTF